MKKTQLKKLILSRIRWCKIIFIMKLTTFILFMFIFSAHTMALSQQKLSMELGKVTLKEVLTEFERQTNLIIVYSDDIIETSHAVKANFKDISIEDFLNSVLKDTKMSYSKMDEYVVIYNDNSKTSVSQSQVETTKVQGTIKDIHGNPLPGVTIRLDGTTLGTSTNIEGYYSLNLPVKTGKLIFSFIGFKQVVHDFKGDRTLDLTMEDDIEEMEEVVVTGMFNKAKESYTGAVNVISREEIKNFSGRNLISTVANLEPSFNLLSNNYFGSNPNILPNVQIRGNASLTTDLETLKDENSDRNQSNVPLILVDGFEISLEEMMDMNENEVASIHILKDAAATSLYGSKAASGVIVITTIEPDAGKLRINYQADAIIETPDLSQYRLLNAREKLEYERLRGRYQSDGFNNNETLLTYYNSLLAEVERGVNTYWLSKPLRTSVSPSQYLKLEGGSKEFRYHISFRYKNTNGVMKKSGRETVNGEISLLYRGNDKISFKNALVVNLSNAKNSPYGSFSSYADANPYRRPYDENGNLIKRYSYPIGVQGEEINPLYNSTVGSRSESEYTKIENRFSIEWHPLTTLKLKGMLGLSRRFDESHNFKAADDTAFEKAEFAGDGVLRKGSYVFSTKQTNDFNFNMNGFYTKTFVEKHMFQIGANFKVQQNSVSSYNIKVEGFPNPDMDFFGAAMMYEKDGIPGGDDGKTRDITFTSNLSYYYDSRYVIDGSFTESGSSKYGKNNRWGGFYSIGLGWNVHNEHFFNNNIMNRFKFRYTYGTSGSDRFGYYMGYTLYTYSNNDRYGVFTGAKLTQLGNPDLKWQSTNTSNFGVEMGFVNDRIYLEADYYLKTTKNMVTTVNLRYSNGFTGLYENSGDIDNNGVEIKLNTNIIRNIAKGISWNVNINAAHEKNKIKKLSTAMMQMSDSLALAEKDTDPSKFYRVGDDTQAFYTVRSLGIDPATGKEVFMNRYGEVTYTWDARDKVKSGTTNPKVRGNINTTFRWQNLTFSANFNYRWGAKLYNQTLINRVENVSSLTKNVDKRVLYDRWQKPGDKTFFKNINNTEKTLASSRFVQKEKYLECTNLMLRYDFANLNWVKKNLYAEYLSLQFDARDIFYWTTIKRERGIDYPFSRAYTFKLTATF